MNSAVMKRSVVIGGHKTSISLENEFWYSLKKIAKTRKISPSKLVTEIESRRQDNGNLSSAIRLYVLNYYATAPDSSAAA